MCSNNKNCGYLKKKSQCVSKTKTCNPNYCCGFSEEESDNETKNQYCSKMKRNFCGGPKKEKGDNKTKEKNEYGFLEQRKSSPHIPIVHKKTDILEAEISSLKSQISKQKTENLECSICMDNSTNIAMIPCGHTCCERCSMAIVNKGGICHICRQKITQMLKIYH